MLKKAIIVLGTLLIVTGLIIYLWQYNDTELIDEPVSSSNSFKHQAWLQFQIDEVNELVSINGKLKKQAHVQEVLAVFAENFPNKTIAHDIELDVLIRPDNLLVNHLTYLLPSIDLIKVAKIKLTDNTLMLGGLVRDASSEYQVINTLKQIFTNEVIIKNSLEKVIKTNEPIKPLEFSLPALPPIENNQQE